MLLTGASGRLGTSIIEMIDDQLDIIALTHRRELQTASRDTTIFDVDSGHRKKPSVRSIRCDLSSEKEIDSVIKVITSLVDKIDYVIYAAGDLRFLGPTTDALSLADDIRKQFELNVLAPALVCSALFNYQWKHISENCQSASVLIVSSLSGSKTFPGVGQGFYAASKAAVNMLVGHMANEYGRYAISVNGLLPNSFPGLLDTKIVASHALRILSGGSSGQLFKIDGQ